MLPRRRGVVDQFGGNEAGFEEHTLAMMPLRPGIAALAAGTGLAVIRVRTEFSFTMTESALM